MVAPYRFTSSTNPDAVKRSRIATSAPTCIAGIQLSQIALEWNSGIEMYPTSSGRSPMRFETARQMPRTLPWELMTPLGSPVVPDV